MFKTDINLLIATRNAGKLREFELLLAELSVELKSLEAYPELPDVEETGATFAANAELKASEYARQTNVWTLADDSGLEVDALGGAPGVFSARYAGRGATNREKIAKLLEELEKTSDLARKARFICVIAFANPNGEVVRVEKGVCEGKIAFSPCGINGFGYDPIFIPEGFEQTFGELSGEIKQQISHRARASSQIKRFLHDLFKFSLDHADFTD